MLGFDHRADEVALKRRAAYVSPELNFQVWGKVGKAIRFVRGFYPTWDDAYCAELMKAFHLSDTDRIITLSFGAKTKLSLLLALARRPEVLILDEPTTGLDAVSKQQVFGELLKAVEDGERTVLISSHGLSDIERFADHVGMIKNGKLLLEGRTDEIVDRYRLAEFFTSQRHGRFESPEPGGSDHFEVRRKPLARAARSKKRRAKLAASSRRAKSHAHPRDAGGFVRGAGQRRGGRMKRLILDYFRRWWWMLALGGALQFWIGGSIVSHPDYPFEFWIFMVSIWMGAILLGFDLKRGVARAAMSLPLTARQIGRAWWLATIPVPAIWLGALLFLGAGTAHYFHPGKVFPTERLALASLFVLPWLGTAFTSIYGMNNDAIFGTRRERFNINFFSLLSVAMLFGGMLTLQDSTKQPLKFSIYLAVGVVLIVAGWFRAEKFVLGRASFRLPAVKYRNPHGQFRAPAGCGGIPFLISTSFVRIFLYVAAIVGLMALLMFSREGNSPDNLRITMFAGVSSLMSGGFIIVIPSPSGVAPISPAADAARVRDASFPRNYCHCDFAADRAGRVGDWNCVVGPRKPGCQRLLEQLHLCPRTDIALCFLCRLVG